MKIITFLNTAGDAPANARAIGRILGPLPGPGGGSVTGWHPIIVNAPTEEEAREKLQTWWDAEIAKNAAKKPRGRPKMQAAPGTPDIEDIEETV